MSINTRPLNIAFLHPDLGIGGAERLILDAALGLQSLGHTVTIYTSHHTPTHSFPDSHNGQLTVLVRGNNLFPPHLFSRLKILFSTLRQLHLILSIFIFPPNPATAPEGLAPSPPPYDVVFIDQLSAGIPLVRALWPRSKVLFYCHFPDKLLAGQGGLLKRLYRIPFDWVEEYSTSCAHKVVVNSWFTAGVFSRSFQRIKTSPKVVYPCVDIAAADVMYPPEAKEEPKSEDSEEVKYLPLTSPPRKHLLLSINRFERKKDLSLALTTFSHLPPNQRKLSRLVLAGGYDPLNSENHAHHLELSSLATRLGLRQATARNYISALDIPSDVDVVFLLSVPARLKSFLLRNASLLMYTPANEHFGIVPLEAMLARCPVLAQDSGGPLETVVEGVTGWLRGPDEKEWCMVVQKALFGMSREELRAMGEAGRERVIRNFSKEKMAVSLESEMMEILDGEDAEEDGGSGKSSSLGPTQMGVVLGVLVAILAWYYYLQVLV